MVSLDLSEIIQQKNLNAREIDFINKLIKQGGKFSNKELARLWGAKTFPAKIKKKLLSKPPILNLIQNKPQIYMLVSEKEITRPPYKEKKIKSKVFDREDKILKEIQTLKGDYLKFKQNILNEIGSIKNILNSLKRNHNIPDLSYVHRLVLQ